MENEDICPQTVMKEQHHQCQNSLKEINQEIGISLKTLEDAQVQMIVTETETEIATVIAIKTKKEIAKKIKTKIVIKIETETETGQGAETEAKTVNFSKPQPRNGSY